jgi:hypothetical protein
VPSEINSVLAAAKEEEQVEDIKQKTLEPQPIKAGKWQNNGIYKKLSSH